jgi:hypothetical protein
MKVIQHLKLNRFEAWAGAKETKRLIIENNKSEHFEYLIEDLYPDGLTETQLNDILWFEDEWLCETLQLELEE